MIAKSSLLLAAVAAVAPVVASKPGINVYFGQTGAGSLTEYCEADNFEYVSVSFISASPEADPATGYPTLNLGAHCAADVYEVNGQKSRLLSNCGNIKHGIKACQDLGKKVLLSIGGVFNGSEPKNDYTVSSERNGRDFADFLWGAFGPYDATWTGPRPFDISSSERNAVDGFDFDIEHKFDDQTGYVAMVNRLRKHIDDCDGNQVITAAPECPLVDDFFKLKYLLTNAKFDALFVQFYNNGMCQADKPNFAGFNFDEWVSFLSKTPSKNAKVFVGLQAKEGSAGYLAPATVAKLIDTYSSRPAFGGIMMWDVYTAVNNVDAKGVNYLDSCHEKLVGPKTPKPTDTPQCCTKQYTVKSGDGCWAIADSNGLTLPQLLALNPDLTMSCNIVPGQVLCLKKGTCTVTSTSTTSSSTSTTSTVTTSSTTSSTTTTSSSSSSTTSSATSTSSSATSSATSTSTSTSASSSSSSTTESSTTTTTGSSTSTTTGSSTSTTETSTSSTITTGSTTTVPPTSSTITSSATSSSSTSSRDTCDDEEPTVTSVWPPVTSETSSSTSTTDGPTTTPWTTSTVYRTEVFTVTSCPPEKGPCTRGGVTTVVVPWYTTVCPDTAVPTPTGPACPGGPNCPPQPTGGDDKPVCPGGPNCPKPTGGDDTPVCPGGPNCPKPTGGDDKPVCPGGPNCPKPTGGDDKPVCPGGPNCPKPTTSTTKVTTSIVSTITIPRPSSSLSVPTNNGTASVPPTKPTGGNPVPTGGSGCPGGANCPKPPPVTAGAARSLAAFALPAAMAVGAFFAL